MNSTRNIPGSASPRHIGLPPLRTLASGGFASLAIVLLPTWLGSAGEPGPVATQSAPAQEGTVATTAMAPAPTSVVRFKNGDRLHGRVVAIDDGKLARLASSNISEVMEFSCEDIARINLVPGDSGRERMQPSARLRLVNGDSIVGDLQRLDGTRLEIDTWYAGVLTVPRETLRSIQLLQAQEVLYQGPTGLDGWVVSDSQDGVEGGAWGYESGVFFSRHAGGIAREMHLPDLASIDMDVAWRDFLQLTITIYTESLKVYQLGGTIRGINGLIMNVAPPAQEGAGFYAVQLNRNTVYLLTVRKDGQVINSPMEIISGLERANRARLGVRVDRKKGMIALLIDGQVIKTWKEPEEFAGQGTAVRLVHQGQALVNLSNIRVGRWDGSLEMSPTGPSPKLAHDLAHLRNQDTLSGTLETIEEGKLSFTTSFGTLAIPLERVSRVDVAGAGETKGTIGQGLVRAQFVVGGSLTFELESWAQNRFVARSPVFGRASFDPAAFEVLEFDWQ